MGDPEISGEQGTAFLIYEALTGPGTTLAMSSTAEYPDIGNVLLQQASYATWEAVVQGTCLEEMNVSA